MFSVIDAGCLLLAIAASGVVVALPGIALARAFRLGRADGPLAPVVVGLAILPLLTSVVTRFLGLDAALALTLGLAAAGVVVAIKSGDLDAFLPGHIAMAALAAWLAVLMIEWIDLDIAAKLYQPFTAIDTVKHAATTQAIVDGGAPPHDPFFLRPERASYYYFFYTLAAVAQRLGLGLIDARAAVGGLVFWTGLGLYGLVRISLARTGAAASSRQPVLVLAILATGGLDILGVLRMGLLQGTWIADPVSWNEQVAGWLESLLWVPHHVTGLIAAMLGLLTLASVPPQYSSELGVGRDQATDPCPQGAGGAHPVLLAALCFASALGLSVWITLGLIATAALWGIMLLVERRWRLLGLLALAGGLAILLAIPQFTDLLAGRTPGSFPSPIVPTVRAFTPVDALVAAGPWRLLARAIALPVNYFAGFGVLASGAILFWLERGRARLPEAGRVLVAAAVAGLLLGAFLKSTLLNNDLGWRVVLFPLLAGSVWTIAALDRRLASPVGPAWRRAPAFLVVLLVLGWATSLYALVGMRAYPWLSNEAEYRFIGADPATERALRVAYEWADRALPPGAVLQHDPGRPRAFAFALYGRHRTAVTDSYGTLFGAVPAVVEARLDALAPLFRTELPAAEVAAVARANHVDDLVVTAADPIWSKPDSFVWRATPAYASDRVRIIPVATLADLPEAPPRPGTTAAAAR